MAVIHKIIGIILSVIFSILVFTTPSSVRTERDKDVLLRAAFMSDTHVTQDTGRMTRFRRGVTDVTKNVRPDVFVITGDVTDHGQEEHWNAVTAVTTENLDVPYSIFEWGDHDTWNDGGYDASKDLYLKNVNEITGVEHDAVDFCEVINGYTFIILGSQTDSVEATIYDDQISRVKEQLAAARSRDDKPVFVINHQPLSGAHYSAENRHEDCFEDPAQSAKLQAELDKYKNVFYFSGHQHNGLNDGRLNYPKGYKSVETVGDNITSVNLPSFQFGNLTQGGYVFPGSGVVMDVYEDCIELTGRNFGLGCYISSFRISIPLK